MASEIVAAREELKVRGSRPYLDEAILVDCQGLPLDSASGGHDLSFLGELRKALGDDDLPYVILTGIGVLDGDLIHEEPLPGMGATRYEQICEAPDRFVDHIRERWLRQSKRAKVQRFFACLKGSWGAMPALLIVLAGVIVAHLLSLRPVLLAEGHFDLSPKYSLYTPGQSFLVEARVEVGEKSQSYVGCDVKLLFCQPDGKQRVLDEAPDIVLRPGVRVPLQAEVHILDSYVGSGVGQCCALILTAEGPAIRAWSRECPVGVVAARD